MKDITTREDITDIIERFYDRLLNDDIVGELFKEEVLLTLADHIDKVVDFWDHVLIGESQYRVNVMYKHLDLHMRHRLSEDMFKRWLIHLEDSVNESYVGEKAQLMLQRADSVAKVMLMKINILERQRLELEN